MNSKETIYKNLTMKLLIKISLSNLLAMVCPFFAQQLHVAAIQAMTITEANRRRQKALFVKLYWYPLVWICEL